MWVPYFSVHFSPYDAQRGLDAYRLLRQFSLKRQLSPPPEMITHTEETIERYKPRDPNELEEWEKTWKPRIGQIMQKKERARILMDQKATSVADLAAVLSIVNKTRNEAISKERWEARIKALKKKEAASLIVRRTPDVEPAEESKLSIKARKRLRRQRAREQLHKEEVAKKIAILEKEISRREHVDVEIGLVPELTGAKIGGGQVRILWKDVQYAQYARSWPGFAVHEELEHSKEHFFTHRLKSQRPVVEETDSAFEEADAALEEADAGAGSAESSESAKPEAVESEEKKKLGVEKLKFWKN